MPQARVWMGEMKLSIWGRLIEPSRGRAGRPMPLYAAIVSHARDPRWYAQGRVADTIDGRFDMLALVMVLVLARLDREGEPWRATAVQLTECFIADMDGQMRQIGIGDFVVGKHVGKMMGALGGRIDAYGDALDQDDGALRQALVRNLYRGEAPPEAALDFVAGEVRRLHQVVGNQPLEGLMAGKLDG